MDGLAMRRGERAGRQQQPQQADSATPLIPTHSWYPPSVLGPATSPSVSSPSSSSGASKTRAATASSSSSESGPHQLPSISNALPVLKNKSAEELRVLLMDNDMYNSFLHSLDRVREIDALRDDLKKGIAELARYNLGKEAEIAELRNQCMIIRNTQVAAARERFEEVDKREKEINGRNSPASLLDRLQDAATEADEESEKTHQQVLDGDIDIGEFVSKYRKQRLLYHKRALTRLAAMTSLTAQG